MEHRKLMVKWAAWRGDGIGPFCGMYGRGSHCRAYR